MFIKLKRTCSNNSLNYIPKFKHIFSELNKISNEDLCDRFIELNLDFYYEEKTSVSFWIRLTFPFALLLMLLMIICLPICYLITGNWRYILTEKKNVILNWFRSLNLLF